MPSEKRRKGQWRKKTSYPSMARKTREGTDQESTKLACQVNSREFVEIGLISTKISSSNVSLGTAW